MKKILLFGMYENAMYHPLTDIDIYLKSLVSDKELDVTDQIEKICEAEQYDAVISYWDDWNEPIPEKAANALYRYVENGGSLLALHNGISIQLQDRLKKLVGGKFITHPEQETLTFVVKKNEMTDGCKDFSMKEEPYQFELEDDGKEIILTYLYREKEYPAGWRKYFGKGKVVYLAPGHTIHSFFNPEYTLLIRKSLEWLI